MADNNGRGQASTRSRWHRLGCWIWLRIIVLVLVPSLLVAYSVEVFRCSSFEPTGDALYDRYAKAVISRQRWVFFHGGKHHPTYLPDSLLAQWESDFGSDPRYWQLRYFCARHKGAFGSFGQGARAQMSNMPLPRMFLGFRPWDTEPAQLEIDAWKHLQAGIDNGAADWVTHEFFHRQLGRDFYYEMDDDLEALKVAGLEEHERRIAMGEILGKYEQLELDGLNAMVDADPSQAWPYYWRAKYWFKYGESELALANIKSGNAAPNNEMSKVFPVGFLLERMSNGSQLGSNIFAGAIFEVDSYSALPNWIKWKDHYKEAQGMVALGGDTEILQELHLAACRLGLAENCSPIEQTVVATLESMLSSTLLVEYGSDLTYQQRRTMQSMNSRARTVHASWGSWADQTWIYTRNYPRIALTGTQMNVVIMRNSEVFVYPPDHNFFHPEKFWQELKPRLYYTRALWVQQQQRTTAEVVRDSFEQLEYVNLSTLEWPTEWGNPY